MKNNEQYKIAFTYVGAIVGAGFATGQEIYQFFTIFGSRAIWGALVSVIGFIVFGWMFMTITYTEKIYSYKDFLLVICGKELAKIFDLMISCFLFGGYTIMLAAGSSLVKNNITNSHLGATIFVAAIIYLSFLKGTNGIIKLNSILIPILMLIIVGVCTVNIVYPPAFLVFSKGLIPKNPTISGLTYLSYNLIIGMVVLSSLKGEIYKKKSVINAPIIAGLSLGLMMFLIIFATMGLQKPSEIPILDLAHGIDKIFFFILIMGVGIAILTSALASGHGLIIRLQQRIDLKYNVFVFIITIMAIPLSLMGFTSLIKFIYPLFGFINYLIMFFTVLYFIRKYISLFKV